MTIHRTIEGQASVRDCPAFKKPLEHKETEGLQLEKKNIVLAQNHLFTNLTTHMHNLTLYSSAGTLNQTHALDSRHVNILIPGHEP